MSDEVINVAPETLTETPVDIYPNIRALGLPVIELDTTTDDKIQVVDAVALEESLAQIVKHIKETNQKLARIKWQRKLSV